MISFSFLLADSIIFHCATHTTGVPMLTAIMGGRAAYDVELDSDAAVVDAVLRKLRRMCKVSTADRDKVQTEVPEPLAYCVTRWQADPYARGGHSFPPPGEGSDLFDHMARTVAGRVFWAGQATNRRDPSSMEGVSIVNS